jgi:hypothetical protein
MEIVESEILNLKIVFGAGEAFDLSKPLFLTMLLELESISFPECW